MPVPAATPRAPATSAPSAFAITGARRFETFVRGTAYLIVSMPLVTITTGTLLPALAQGTPPLVAGIAAALTLALVVGNIAVSRSGIDHVVGSASRSTLIGIVVWLALLVALVVVLVPLPATASGVAIAAAVGSVAASVVPRLSIRSTTFLTIAVVILTTPSVLLVGIPLHILNIVVIALALWGSWFTVWNLRVMRELQRVYVDHAELTLANERLRISRDLHDVFGRTLATIALKSELASELIRRGDDARAAEEILAVRQLADAAGTEVRRVIRGELHPTWETELAGARSLLRSAGISCTTSGDAVPAPAAHLLAWVVREGITNVLRHSHATRVTIATAMMPDEVRLLIVNDGADVPSTETHMGTGLTSMAARLRTDGGVVSTRVEGEWFTLDAAVPHEGDRS